jgi:hypothetical protein
VVDAAAIVESEGGQRHACATGGVGCCGARLVSLSLLAIIGEGTFSALRTMSMQGGTSESQLTGRLRGRNFARHGVGSDDANKKGKA